MKKISSISMVCLLLFSACMKNNSKEKQTIMVEDTMVYNVKTFVLKKQQISRSIEYTANLIAYEEIHYAPAAPGRIEEIAVEVGSRIKKGDVIARMDQTQLLQANEQFQNARANFLRMDTLFKLKSVSEQQYEAVKTQYEVAKASVDFLSRNTILLSPINGIVTAKYFESGEMYSAAPNTPAAKAAIVTLMQIQPIKAKIYVSEKYFPIVKKGMKAMVSVDIFGDKKFPAEIFRIYPTIYPDSRTFPVELVIDNADEILRPGMFARVYIDMGKTDGLLVPVIAVIKQEGTNNRYVFVVTNDNRVKKIAVNIGSRYDDRIEILSDNISEGDNIVVAGHEKLKDGSKITIVQ